MKTVILGGGLAGLSLAHLLNQESIILEKEDQPGGLCRSFTAQGIPFDVGPHILFSKNAAVLAELTSLTNVAMLRRSNKIFHKNRFVKYPFENELSALDQDERTYCLNEFLHNPYENYQPQNMLQFFLKTFGEGITRTYLQPYNEKIWKFDASCMDLQMVERIPKPPAEDIIKSANGIATEGYKHQLHFYYPEKGGMQSIINSLQAQAAPKTTIINNARIKHIERIEDVWHITTNQGVLTSRRLVNCMPLHELGNLMILPDAVTSALSQLLYNSIHIVIVQAKKDHIGDNFAIYNAEKNVIFHRVSKLNFLGPAYCLPNGGSTLLAEITFRASSTLGLQTKDYIEQKVVNDLVSLGFVDATDIFNVESRTFKYAYVIYDLNHRKNTDIVLGYLESQGISSCGRFAEFEYLNSDGVLEHSINLAKKLNAKTEINIPSLHHPEVTL